MSSDRKNSRLPPPAFPPGSRRKLSRSSSAQSPAPEDPPAGGGGTIFPDDPMPPRSEPLPFISPDDPMPPRRAQAETGFVAPDEKLPVIDPDEELEYVVEEEEDDGLVTGMGFDPHLDPSELVTGGDPYVMEVSEAVRKLARALEQKGEAGLHASPAMGRFEATLRAYCVGYIAGRRGMEDEEFAEISRHVKPKAEPPDF